MAATETEPRNGWAAASEGCNRGGGRPIDGGRRFLNVFLLSGTRFHHHFHHRASDNWYALAWAKSAAEKVRFVRCTAPVGGEDGWQDGRKCFQANQLLRSETKAHSCQNRYTGRVEQANTLLPDDGKAQSNYSSHLAECRNRFSISHGCILSEGGGISLAMT